MPRVRFPENQSQVPSSLEEPAAVMPLDSSSSIRSNDSNTTHHYTNHNKKHRITMHDTQIMNTSKEKDNDEWDLDFESSIPSTAVVWHSTPMSTSESNVPKRRISSSSSPPPTTTTTTNEIKSIFINQQHQQHDHHTNNPSNKKNKSVQFKNNVQFRQKQPPQRVRKPKSFSTTKGTRSSMVHGTLVSNSLHSPKGISSSSSSWMDHDSMSPSSVAATATTSNRSVTQQDDMMKTIMSKDLIASRNDILPKRGIGIDTRYLQSFVGDAISQQYRSLVYEFLSNCAESSLLPSVLSCTTTSITSTSITSSSNNSSDNTNPPASSTRTNIQCKGNKLKFEILSEQNMMTHNVITPVSIHPCEDIHKTNTTLTCPMELKATESWVQLDALVISILMESIKGSNAFPMDITIITNDAAFFVDTNIDAHKNGVSHFWNRMRSQFNTNKVKSIQIVCFCTGVDTLSYGANDHFDPSILSASSTTGDGTTAVATTNVTDGSSGCSRDSRTASLSPSGEALGVSHRFNVHFCANAIINELVSLSIKESSDGPYRDTSDSKNPMDITFSIHDCHMIYFENLLRNWTRETFYMTCPKGRISFDLPETLDGTQCTVTLDLSYKILPFQVDSLAAATLVEDMKVISNSTFSVVQLVPLDKVDISLIYGVPFVAKAGLEGDIDQYKEIQRLYNELLKYLLTKDCGLVLCSETSGTMSAFKNAPEKSIYLLMAQEEEFDLDGSRDVLLKGTLHRYCRKSNQILEPVSMTNTAVSYDDTNVDVYSEVVKNALEFIPTAMINPSSLGSTKNF